MLFTRSSPKALLGFPPLRRGVREEGLCPPSIGALTTSPAVALRCCSPWPCITISWGQAYVLLRLYRSGAHMHPGLLLCSLEIKNGGIF